MINSNVSGPDFDTPRIAMIQDGARLRYAVPLVLERAGILDRAFIDWFVRNGSIEQGISRLIRRLQPTLGRRMAERTCPELPDSRVIRNPSMVLRLHLGMRKFPHGEDAYIWASRETAKWIIRKGFGNSNILHGFIRNAAPEAYRAAKSLGLKTSGDQIIAPLEVELAEMKRQIKEFPDWKTREGINVHEQYLDFERQTWQTLDAITCASDYVRDGLVSVGISPERITVAPYPWVAPAGESIERIKKSGPLTVGFVGGVGLRKGAPWFLETAKRFNSDKIRFIMVGLVLLDHARLEALSDRVQFVGAVPHSQIASWLAKFDVFFFPSTCEGSAGAVLEAMGAALPIITTPNSGSRVRDGIEGFVRPYEDIDGFEQAIRRFDDDRDLLLAMGNAARERVRANNLEAYQADLAQFFQKLVQVKTAGLVG